jgi:hypothetical protein
MRRNMGLPDHIKDALIRTQREKIARLLSENLQLSRFVRDHAWEVDCCAHCSQWVGLPHKPDCVVELALKHLE